jgi:glycosyl-4,4'-diaponeurosporenoate acyltransferase
MPVVSLTIVWTIILDAIAWALFHLVISILCSWIPLQYFQRSSSFYKIATWEKSGQFWQNLVAVKKWKSSIPDAARLFKIGFEKKLLAGCDAENLQTFAAETKRAELTHWLSILPAPLFFLWNPFWAGWVMILYAVVFNIPIIIVQRYNRARLETILKRLEIVGAINETK